MFLQFNNYIFLVLSAIFGAILPFAFAPFDFYVLSFISYTGLSFIWLINKKNNCFLTGLLFGLAAFSIGVSWVYISLWKYGNAAFVFALAANIGLIIYLSLYIAFAGFLLRKYSHPRTLKRALLIPFLLSTMELLRAYLISGFPWLSVAYSQLDTVLRNLAPIGGVFLIGFIFYLICVFFAYTIVERKAKYLFLPLSLLFISYLCGFIKFTDSTNERVSIALIQGNIDTATKFEAQQMREDFLSYINTASQRTEDIIVLPETAITYMRQNIEDIIASLDAEYSQKKQSLITGIPFYGENESIYYNGIIVLGDGKGVYAKEHLLPFGEYIPFEFIFSFFRKFVDMPMSNFSNGGKKQDLLIAKNYKIAASICFEAAFGRVIQYSMHRNNMPDFLINVSNDGWFTGSNSYAQHFQMHRMRALEFQRDLARASHTGITAIIDHKAKIRSQIPLNQKAVLSSFVEKRVGRTYYAIFGNYIIITLLFLYFILIFYLFNLKAKIGKS